MKHLTMLLAALLCVLGAAATDYTGTVTVKTISTETTREGMTLSVDQNENGTYNATMSFAFKLLGRTLAVENVEFERMLGVTTSDGYTTITGIKEVNLMEISGLSDIIPSWLQKYVGTTLDTSVPFAFSSRFNGTYATATLSFVLNLSITIPILDKTYTIVDTPVLVAFEDFDPATINPGSGIQGDVNNSGNVDIDDVNELINILLAK
ncbi:MAG: hypothetical protein IJT30_03710 [Muribaculaceae bacterium]|nr:hypothetical protein [Muribaculaceae bacterium]